MALIPTDVTLEDLIDETSDINLFNDGIKTQAASPRTLGAQKVVVKVKDDPFSSPVASGTCDANVLNSVSDSSEDFVADGVAVGDTVIATVSGLSATVTVVATSVLTMDADICPLGTETYTVIPATFWEQSFGEGEWKRSGTKLGNDVNASYTLPVDTNSTVVHYIVYPIALANIGTYPPTT